MTAETAPFIDTSVVLRYLTADPPELSRQAADLIEQLPSWVLSEVAICEIAYVLESVYRVQRDKVVDALSALIQRHNVRVLGLPKATALEALDKCRGSRRVSFTDALIWAQARHAGAPKIWTFDRRFPALEG